MKATTYFGLAVGLLFQQIPLVYSAITSLQNIAPAAAVDNSTVSATTYIIELASTASSGGARKRSLTPHQDLYDALRRKDVSFSSGTEWNVDDLFVGLVLTVTNAADLLHVANTANVVAVRPVVFLQSPGSINQHIPTGPNDPALPPDTQSTHVMTGVDKVHAEGNAGQGVNIAVIDTGVDYTNPALGGGFGPGFLIKGGYDFVGDAYTGSNTPVPDSDPLDTCNGHGTHTTGIIAAQPGNPYNITGVAYKANIYAYRVLGCSGTVQDPIVISALLQAVQDGNDVFTMSLGVAAGWTETTVGVVASRIAQQGKVVTVSVGNDGAQGAWFPSSPATGDSVIAVGSVDNTDLPVTNATLSDGHAPVTYFSFKPFPISGSLPIYATSTDITTPADACNSLPSNTPNLANYLVVIRRGGCPILTKFQNAQAKGARYFFLYNDGEALGYVTPAGWIGALIGAEDGAYLVNAFATNANLRVSFPQTGAFTQTAIAGGGLISFMSSFGPTYDMRLKPSIVAPGGNILSTFLRAVGGFAIESGTSMACPFVAGTAALVIHAKGRDANTVRGIKKLLQNTAGMVPSAPGDVAPLTTAAQQGAGLVNAYHAIHAQSVISANELLLNDTVYGSNYQIITISNPTSKSVTYTLTHSPALTVSTIDNTDALPVASPLPTIPQSASVSFTSTKVTVWPRLFNAFMVTIKPPTGVDATTFPIYSGFISISSSIGETFSIPYMGVAARMKDMHILDTSETVFGVPLPITLNAGTGDIVDPNTTFTFQGSDYPAVLYRRAAGSPSLLADLVKPDIQLSGLLSTSARKRKRGLLWDWLSGLFGNGNGNGNTHSSSTFSAVKTIGPITNMPYSARHEITDTSEGTDYDFVRIDNYLNSTAIANGSYKLLLRALKITGDPTNEADYEAWLSPEFIVNNPAAATTTTTTAAASTTTAGNSPAAVSSTTTLSSASHSTSTTTSTTAQHRRHRRRAH